MIEGLYEELVTKLVSQKLSEIDKNKFHIFNSIIDREEAAQILSLHLCTQIKHALATVNGDDQLLKQIEISNKIIILLKEELHKSDFEEELVESEGKILRAVFSKVNTHFTDLNLYLKEITPYTRLTHSELFTGGNAGISLESELRKEILSSNKIDLLVSFIKWKGIIILERELIDFTENGGKLRIITTTYLGASDYKAIEFLSQLKNTEVKVSYNTSNERLHAKAYLFRRDSGFHTGYIGSSNFSRSALTDGLEWNLKITTKEVSHIIDKFQKTFDAYWQNSEFELFEEKKDSEKLRQALKQGQDSKGQISANIFFDIKPYPYQSEILETLEVERKVHNRYRNLLVAATGTGKTVISAFDYKDFSRSHNSSRLLYIAHRKEILIQARGTFQAILKDNNFGELFVDGIEPTSYGTIFASVQTMNNRLNDINLSEDYFDFIIVDEVHHMAAASYRPIVNYFKPKILLGLTATPERMDGANILDDFCNRIAAEIRLPEALNRKLLCPFQYFGISDSIDLSSVKWEKGRYVAGDLSNLYTASDRRVGEIISNLNKYTKNIQETVTLAFCASIEHALFMAQKFSIVGLKAKSLTSKNSADRDSILLELKKREINYLFVVDIFNEGVDIPEIDTVLFLRPTESLTVFLQQLGRGLRLSEAKDCLTVLDFVGNARPEYDFESKFRAIIGKTNFSVQKEVEDNFPHLPLGCSIILEKKAKQDILDNIKRATNFNTNQLLLKIQNFPQHTLLPLSLKNFVNLYNIPLQVIYKKNSWKRLCQVANGKVDFEETNEGEIIKAIRNKWLSTNSTSYFQFILNLAKKDFLFDSKSLSEADSSMLLMLYYDVWQDAARFNSLEEAILAIGKNKVFVEEIIEVLEILLDSVNFIEIEIDLPFNQPLKVHARYTRDQILVAFGFSTFEKKSSNREGVAENVKLKTEILFIDLFKSEENFSPTTMYDDYAISEHLFHWQSQNQTRPDLGKGLSYINHKMDFKRILLFVREKSSDIYGNTTGYVFIGEGYLKEHYGSKPMSIKWELKEPMPHYLWKDSAKFALG